MISGCKAHLVTEFSQKLLDIDEDNPVYQTKLML